MSAWSRITIATGSDAGKGIEKRPAIRAYASRIQWLFTDQDRPAGLTAVNRDRVGVSPAHPMKELLYESSLQVGDQIVLGIIRFGFQLDHI
jgi:hypothetical protein